MFSVRARTSIFFIYKCISVLLLVLASSGCGELSSLLQPVAQGAPLDTNATVEARTRTFISTSTAKVVASPIHLAIPAIGVNAPIEQVSILSSGDLATPTQNPWDGVGWYDVGPSPGQRGSAVIDGHLDRPGGYPAIFWRLRDMHTGDEVLVSDSDGKTLHFRVTRVTYYAPQDAPLQDIFGNRSGNYLNLVTCAGDWIPSQHQTTLRLVVYTSLA